MTAGSYVLVVGDLSTAVGVRIDGLQLRDTLLLAVPGPMILAAFLFRQPTSSTTAESALCMGSGLLNIDPCRVRANLSEFFSSTGKPRSGLGHARGYGMGEGFGGDMANPPHPGGRWPPNLLLVHSTYCSQLANRRVPGHKGYPNGPGGKSMQYTSGKRGSEVRPHAWQGHADQDGMEDIPSWKCVSECPAHALELLSGASRFFPQFGTMSEALSWLDRLLTLPMNADDVTAG